MTDYQSLKINERLLPAVYTLDLSLKGQQASYAASGCKSDCFSCESCKCHGCRGGVKPLENIGKSEVERLFVQSLFQ